MFVTSIVMAADEKYLPFVPCSFAQLAAFGRQAEGITLVVPATIGDDHRARTAAAASAYGLALEILPIPELDTLSASGLINDCRHVSRHTYSKLLFSEILPHLDQVLYLDVDTLIRAPLDDLLSWELRHPLGAVAELGDSDYCSGTHLFGTARQPYFNAGVLRLSLKRMRDEHSWDRSTEILKRRPGLIRQDQDVLNLVFRDDFESLPLTFNVFDSEAQAHRTLAVLQDPVIVHFAGPIKPWHRSATSPFAREWQRRFAEAALSADLPLEVWTAHEPEESNKYRIAYNRARKAGRSRLGSAARSALPPPVKRAARNSALSVVDRALSRIERVRLALAPPARSWPSSPWETPGGSLDASSDA